ncbi:type 1 glutamine amidotransferase domain-containing protein [Leucobacter insecticola]|uniref:type 1 glutamine amidotransferase domain-containing protein n=1 Tax=Leucobacter insecticola TaxID=2714934 RepID=UPI0019804C9D|nr:type 1 glutamine amidotransferase domain-containing protein [Leucobacter insecticola]
MSTTARALLVLTSHDDLGGVRKTGYYVGEAAHPWQVFTEAGFEVDLASVAGGVPPEDGRDESDPAQRAFVHDTRVAAQLANTPALADVRAEDYDIVFFVGGHGTMWDFPHSAEINRIGRTIYERGGIVSAVCHGPAALVGMTLSDGTPLVAGKRVSCFTNAEEAAVELTEIVPFLLASTLAEQGAEVIEGPTSPRPSRAMVVSSPAKTPSPPRAWPARWWPHGMSCGSAGLVPAHAMSPARGYARIAAESA